MEEECLRSEALELTCDKENTFKLFALSLQEMPKDFILAGLLSCVPDVAQEGQDGCRWYNLQWACLSFELELQPQICTQSNCDP